MYSKSLSMVLLKIVFIEYLLQTDSIIILILPIKRKKKPSKKYGRVKDILFARIFQKMIRSYPQLPNDKAYG